MEDTVVYLCLLFSYFRDPYSRCILDGLSLAFSATFALQLGNLAGSLLFQLMFTVQAGAYLPLAVGVAVLLVEALSLRVPKAQREAEGYQGKQPSLLTEKQWRTWMAVCALVALAMMFLPVYSIHVPATLTDVPGDADALNRSVSLFSAALGKDQMLSVLREDGAFQDVLTGDLAALEPYSGDGNNIRGIFLIPASSSTATGNPTVLFALVFFLLSAILAFLPRVDKWFPTAMATLGTIAVGASVIAMMTMTDADMYTGQTRQILHLGLGSVTPVALLCLLAGASAFLCGVMCIHTANAPYFVSPIPQKKQLRFVACTDVPAGHKIALTDLDKDAHVIKYGFPIGYAKEAIPQGSHIHVHNLHTLLGGELTYTWHPTHPHVERQPSRTFPGFPRKGGKVGVRNELWILPTVGCVNDIARGLERDAQQYVGEGLEAVYAFSHPYGCSQMGEDQEHTRQMLANLAVHPNAGGVLVLGLGCENSGVEEIRRRMGDYDESRVRFLICQNVEDEHAAAMDMIRELAEIMRSDDRVPCSASDLVIGLKCGGSDGFSGITANPVIGGFSDRLIAQGGTTILTEVPEMFGAETILMNRCEDEETFEKTVSLINDFKHYFEDHHQTIYENPSPGNKAGGITTLEDKALGCTQKSGFAPVRDVLRYAERVRTKGLNLLSAPGNDLVAATALAAAGAQIILFSTGRGTPFACPVPTVKISSNSGIAERKHGWIDFNAGQLLDTDKTLPQLSEELMELVLDVAGGQKVCSERNGFHDLAIFKEGVTL